MDVRWEMGGDQAAGLGSGLGLSVLTSPAAGVGGGGSDPFADESAEKSSAAGGGSTKEVPVIRRIISGKYTAT